MRNRFELHRLLWDLRRDPGVVRAWEADRDAVLRSYQLEGDEADAVMRRDFAALLEVGVSPLLLYFGALEMGVSRDEYYAGLAQTSDQTPGSPNADASAGDGC